MSQFAVGNVYLLLSMTLATGSQVLFKGLVDAYGEGSAAGVTLREFLTTATLLRGVLAGSMLVAGFALWILCLTKLELSYAYPLACSSVLLVAWFSALFLGEPVSARMWVGTLLVLGGLVLLTPRQ
ncbi:MAG: EamA family transporter [bacterium]|nr:EamA family transporter [bacterium]